MADQLQRRHDSGTARHQAAVECIGGQQGRAMVGGGLRPSDQGWTQGPVQGIERGVPGDIAADRRG
eukprot:178422-Alexandrium_andersonii.AAC.1